MGNGKLSHTLLDLGFFSALGTTERIGGEETLVERRAPNAWDYNNGALVVYDEAGRPWILPGEKFNDDTRDAIGKFGLKRGAYVPHSNDGGGFIHTVVKK